MRFVRGAAGENLKLFAEQCGTSIQIIQDNYGGYMNSDFGQRLMAELGEQTET